MSCVTLNWLRRKKERTTGEEGLYGSWTKEQYASYIKQLQASGEMWLKERNECFAKLAAKEETNPLETYWNNKYPQTKIVYKGRPLPYGKENVDLPVNVLITPNDPDIIKDLKDWGMYKTGEDVETLVPKIWHKIMTTFYKYQYDKTVWGVNEVWEFPFEVRYKMKNGVDCDSWSHFIMSYYAAAGVPEWKTRVVCGNTDLGGHSTVYVYSEKSGKFHHTNSTNGAYYPLLSNYPTHDDAENGKDKIGIKDVWFSFNRTGGWSTFNTHELEKVINTSTTINNKYGRKKRI